MHEVLLGATGIKSGKNAFGALPIQRVDTAYAGMLLRKAYDGGWTFFDTARAYSDSEEKMGLALADVRQHIHIATKTMAKTAEGFWKDLETSLRLLKTDYVDIYQFHNPDFCPKPGDGSGLYEAMLEARAQGKIRFIGLTNHRIPVAEEAVRSGLYDTLQFPFCYLATEADIGLMTLCAQSNMGFIAMKALSGGLLTKPQAAYAWLSQYDSVLPIWGIQREQELEDFLAFDSTPPALTPGMLAEIEADRQALSGDFCRACGYCMPCPAGIEINTCARMAQLIRRSPSAGWLSEAGQARMNQIEQCIGCGQCSRNCPYGLDTPALLRRNLEDYRAILAGQASV